jgi:hypothetical protein
MKALIMQLILFLLSLRLAIHGDITGAYIYGAAALVVFALGDYHVR